jgi:hypothetical protein
MAATPVEKITAAAKESTETFTKRSTAAVAGLQEIAKAYQALAAKNVEKLTASVHAFAAVKTPAELVQLQQKLFKESVESAVTESKALAELTLSVFTSTLKSAA